jgi:hypothetical protein
MGLLLPSRPAHPLADKHSGKCYCETSSQQPLPKNRSPFIRFKYHMEPSENERVCAVLPHSQYPVWADQDQLASGCRCMRAHCHGPTPNADLEPFQLRICVVP